MNPYNEILLCAILKTQDPSHKSDAVGIIKTWYHNSEPSDALLVGIIGVLVEQLYATQALLRDSINE